MHKIDGRGVYGFDVGRGIKVTLNNGQQIKGTLQCVHHYPSVSEFLIDGIRVPIMHVVDYQPTVEVEGYGVVVSDG